MKTANIHLLGLLVGLTLAACQQNSTPTPPPDFELQMGESLTVVQGQQQSLSITLNRKNGHNEAVQLSVEAADGSALPAGISASFTPNSLSANQSQLSVSVAASVAVQDYLLRVRARTATLDKQAPLRLSVQAAPASPDPEPDPAFSLSLAAPSLSVTQGQNGAVQVNISRTNLSGGIQLSLVRQDGSALPGGITASLNPNPATGNSSALQINVATGVTPQSYALQVRGVTGSLNASVNLGLEVQVAPVSQTVTVNAAPHTLTNGQPGLFFQDGDGPWQPLVANNGFFRFAVTNPAGRYGVLAVCSHQEQPSQAINSRIEVRQQTVGEQAEVELCLQQVTWVPDDGIYRAVSGRVDGLTPQSSGVMVAMGGRTTSWELPASGVSPVYTVAAFSPGGIYSLGAARYPSPATSGNPRVANKAIIIRDINITQNPQQTHNLDFASSQAFDLEGPYTINLSGVNPTTSTSASAHLAYWMGNLGLPGDFYWFSNVVLSSTFFLNTANFPYRAIPASRQRAGDAYIFSASDDSPQGSRAVFRSFRNAGNLTVPFLPHANFSLEYTASTPTARWTVGGTDAYQFTYYQDDRSRTNPIGRQLYWDITVSKNWLGNTQSYTAPNMSNQAGWLELWNLRSNLYVQWWFTAYNSNTAFVSHSSPGYDRTNLSRSLVMATGEINNTR